MLGQAHLLRKSTDTREVLLELSDMFSTSTSNPNGHISVFTAYLTTGNSLAVAAHTSMASGRRCPIVSGVHQLAWQEFSPMQEVKAFTVWVCYVPVLTSLYVIRPLLQSLQPYVLVEYSATVSLCHNQRSCLALPCTNGWESNST